MREYYLTVPWVSLTSNPHTHTLIDPDFHKKKDQEVHPYMTLGLEQWLFSVSKVLLLYVYMTWVQSSWHSLVSKISLLHPITWVQSNFLSPIAQSFISNMIKGSKSYG